MRASSQDFAKWRKGVPILIRLLCKRLQIEKSLVAKRHIKQKVVAKHLLDDRLL